MATYFRALALLLTLPAVGHAEQVACHYRYGGDEHVLRASPVASPYDVPALQVGSYFRLRVVYQVTPRDQAAIKVYTYADRDDAPVLIHQASFPLPVIRGRAESFGFTGLQRVYEPLRDGELEYWCQLQGGKRK